MNCVPIPVNENYYKVVDPSEAPDEAKAFSDLKRSEGLSVQIVRTKRYGWSIVRREDHGEFLIWIEFGR